MADLAVEATAVFQRDGKFACSVMVSYGGRALPWDSNLWYAKVFVPLDAIDGPLEWQMCVDDDNFEDSDPRLPMPCDEDAAAIEKIARKCTRDFVAQLKAALVKVEAELELSVPSGHDGGEE